MFIIYIATIDELSQKKIKTDAGLIVFYDSIVTYVEPYILKYINTSCPISGGSPYPSMDGRKIAHFLQEGYRMPKPQHVDDKLYDNIVLMLLNIFCFMLFLLLLLVFCSGGFSRTIVFSLLLKLCSTCMRSLRIHRFCLLNQSTKGN